MAELSPKWILEDGRLIIGKVSRHWELSRHQEIKSLVQMQKHIVGGGWFWIDSETNSFLFYALSSDFGQCALSQVEEAYKKGFVDAQLAEGLYASYPIRFSTCSKLEDAKINNTLLTK